MSDEVKTPQRISRSYRELGAQEPPRALDEAILAASRRGRQRWYAPLATAAVLVLAVAVTLQMQRNQPGIESPAPQVAPPAAVTQTAKEAEKSVAAAAVKAPTRNFAERHAPAAPVSSAAPEPKPFAPNPATEVASAEAPQAGAMGALARREASADSVERADRPVGQARLQASKESDTIGRELERIAELRAQGRHDEADRALAEFRKRYPDYKIPETMRERIERRQ